MTTARDELTGREREIAQLVARGRRNAEIAAELRVAPRTVEWNLTRIYRKLGIRSKVELAARVAGTPWAAGERKWSRPGGSRPDRIARTPVSNTGRGLCAAMRRGGRSCE